MAPKFFGEIAEVVIKRILERRGLVRLEIIVDRNTLDRVGEAAKREGTSPNQLIANVVAAAFPFDDGAAGR